MEVREHREVLISRVRFLRTLVVVALGLVAVSFWFTQILKGGHYRDLAEHNRLRKQPLSAPRGLVYDRHDNLLVENVPSYDLLLDRSRSEDLEASLAFAATRLERQPEDLQRVVDRASSKPLFQPILIAEDLSLAEVAAIEVKSLEHPEFEVEVRHLRLYRHGPQTAHLLGYLGEVTEQQLTSRGYTAGDLVGKRGIEQQFDARLRGQDGEREVVVDSRGRVLEEYGRRPAATGRNLRLSLDLDLQQEAERLMTDHTGAVVILDPRNGEILALYSAPSFNPNLFARRLDPGEWKSLIDDSRHPLQDRTIQSAYSPGSLFKVVIASAGLAEGVIDPGHRVFCGGSTRIYDRRFRCHKRGGHGWVDLEDAIKGSCDIYFYELGQALGIERIARYSRLFGLGGETGIDLPGENNGLVPDLEWSLKARGHRWYPGETISVAIGQGPLLTTPLQIAQMMATVAQDGSSSQPRLELGPKPTAPVAVDLSSRSLEPVRKALWEVVNGERGTGRRASVEGLDIAGKTGTVQVIEQKTWTDSSTLPYEFRDHAWFAAFAPVDDPELVVVVFVEHGGRGSSTAGPIARGLFEAHFSRTGDGVRVSTPSN